MKQIPLFLLAFFFSITGFTQTGNNADSARQKTKKYMPEISGMVQVHYLNEFNTNGDTIRDPDGFRILRARLTASGTVNKYVGYQLMIDPRAPEQGGILRDAYLTLDLIHHQTIRIGQQKTQFGWENRESISELYTVNRAEMSDGACRGENLRDIGIGVLGHFKINDQFRIEDAITLTNGTGMNVEGPYDFNTKKAVWGRVGVRYKTDQVTARLGGSFAFGGLRYLGDDLVSPLDDIYVDFNRYGADLEIDHPQFFFAVEYAAGRDDSSGILYDDPMGYQALFALKTKWDLGPLVRYDVFQDEWNVWTVGAYYGKPKDKFRVLANYIFRGGITAIEGGHDDRLYIQCQVKF